MQTTFVFRAGKLFGIGYSGIEALISAFGDKARAFRFCDRIKQGEFRMTDHGTSEAPIYALNGERIGLLEKI